jgi:hypothetical protein
MHHDRYRDQGMPIGGSIVESAHQHVLQMRMKRTGQHWSLGGARSMAALRAGYRTADPVSFYRAVMAPHRSSHHANQRQHTGDPTQLLSAAE